MATKNQVGIYRHIDTDFMYKRDYPVIVNIVLHEELKASLLVNNKIITISIRELLHGF